jgi:prophage tail gpP-like protein
VTRLISTPTHEVSIVVDGVEIRGIDRYQIKVSITDPVDSFTVSRAFNREVWDHCQLDAPIRVLIDGVPVITGRIDDRDTGDENRIELVGRCNIGRLYDDCAPSIRYGGLGIKEVIEHLALEFFERVVFTNVRDRGIRRGKGHKARAGNEPALLSSRKKTGTQIEPGQTRWAVITQLIEQCGLLAWSSGDGKELIVAQPNYEQEIQFGFFRAAVDSKRAAESNVLSMNIHQSIGERYSRIIVVGSGPGTSVNFGAAVSSRFGEAKNSDATVDGDGVDFTAPKRLVVQRSIASTAEAVEHANREMAKRDAQGDLVQVTCAAHGQRIARAFTTLFAPDLLARVEDERTGLQHTYAIVSCTYSASRDEAKRTAMELVRKGAVLA